MNLRRLVVQTFPIAVLVLVRTACFAQAAPPPAPAGSLVDLVNSGQFAYNTLERLSAFANQASYNALTGNPNSPVFCNPTQIGPSATCPTATFLVFQNLRSLVQTANALLGNGGPTRYSLNINDQALGFALRWTAAEELSAPGSVATGFANAQLAGVAQRIDALRFGASGFTVNGLQMNSGESLLARSQSPARGGGASADDIGIASRWGGFLNSSFGWGERAPSVLEDAFAFDSRDATLGIDYRFSRRFVLGLMGGYSDQRVDFNSSQSVVGGGIRSIGWSLQLYGLYEFDAGPYVNFSVGGQRTNYHTNRLITYPSFNPDVPAVDATATGQTTSTAILSNLNAGWPLNVAAFTAEPYVGLQYQGIRLDGFHETSVNNVTNAFVTAGSPAGFDFDYAQQHINNFEGSVGVRFQYAFRPPFGVIVPYAKAEFHHRFDSGATQVNSSYNAIATSGAGFDLPSDRPNSYYFQYAGGASVVLKHGIQAFVQYQTSDHVAFTTSHLISGGIRGEF